MKPKRERYAVAVCRLVDAMGLDNAIAALLCHFDNAELAAMLSESYVTACRMVPTPDGYVTADEYAFDWAVAQVRRTEAAGRLMTQKTYMESLRKLADAGDETARERLAIECAIHDDMRAELEGKAAPTPVCLTETQARCLRFAVAGTITPWDFGSATLSSLKKRGLIVKSDGKYVATPEGRALIGGAL